MQMRWNSITLCLVDLDYTVIDQLNIAIGAFEPREYVGEVISHLRAFIDRHAERDIWALSVSGPLPVASPGMHASLPRRFAWMDAEWFQSFWEAYSAQSLCDELEAALGLPAYILNNPQSAAIAEALAAPLEARMVYIMVGLSLGATVVNHRQLNLELWRYAGEIGYVMYKDEPLNRIFSVSGLREQLDLDEPQGVYEEIIERVLAETPDVLDDWFDSSAERLRLIVNFLENTVRPDGIAVGGFMPVGYLRELVSRVEPLPDSVVLETDDPQRIMPRLAVARHSAESIPFGAGAMALSSRANSRFSDLIGQRRLPG
ncbi:ROK family protein [Martelella soudanensis]|nr:ROK family protein [Martelella sp. NC18]